MGPETRYARNCAVQIAYQVVGQGPLDLVVGLGWISHLEYLWEEPGYARFIGRLATLGRVILFDKRGVGLSDPVPPDALPTTEERVEDIRAVLDATACDRAVLLGISEGGALAARFAATYPDRTRALIVVNGYARRPWAPDYPWGPDSADRDALYDRLAREWNEAIDLSVFLPTIAADDDARTHWERLLRRGASPGAARTLARMNTVLDVRGALPDVRAPTLILHRAGDQTVSIENGRYLAERIPGAAFVALPGADHLPFVGDQEAVLVEIEGFLGQIAPEVTRGERVLATVLAVELAGAVERAVRLGDRRWGELRQAALAAIHRQIARCQGRVLTPTLDGAVAMFDEAPDALACARAVVAGVASLGLTARAGVHVGELAVVAGEPAGVAVYLAHRIMSQAQPGGVLVSGTVRDLVAGAGLDLEPVGTRAFADLPGDWELFRAGDSGLLLGVDGSIESASAAELAPATLSRREREVAALLAEGRSNRQIASELAISLGTAERHVANVLAKLGFRSRTQVAAWAVVHGLQRE